MTDRPWRVPSRTPVPPSGRCSAARCLRRPSPASRRSSPSSCGGGGDALLGASSASWSSVGFFASGMFLLSRLVRSASPHAFFAVAMAVYLGQVIVLLLVITAFKDPAGRRRRARCRRPRRDPGLAGLRDACPATGAHPVYDTPPTGRRPR